MTPSGSGVARPDSNTGAQLGSGMAAPIAQGQGVERPGPGFGEVVGVPAGPHITAGQPLQRPPAQGVGVTTQKEG